MLNATLIKRDVERALAEDIGSGDITAALLPAELIVDAEIISREPMIMCGQAWVEATFAVLDARLKLTWLVTEGEWLAKGQSLCRITGPARGLLTAERTALNFLQTLAGTATQTYHYVQALQGSTARLLDTRKTLPGLRVAQKYAVHCGGGMNHRLGLYDAFLIKENHIRACGSISAAVTLARQTHPNLLLEVEVENLTEFEEALAACPDRIMLDNFTLSMIQGAVVRAQTTPCQLEVSGGVDLTNIAQLAQTGVHYISVGAITKSLRAIDLSLLIKS